MTPNQELARVTNYSLDGQPYNGSKHRMWPSKQWFTGAVHTFESKPLKFHRNPIPMDIPVDTTRMVELSTPDPKPYGIFQLILDSSPNNVGGGVGVLRRPENTRVFNPSTGTGNQVMFMQGGTYMTVPPITQGTGLSFLTNPALTRVTPVPVAPTTAIPPTAAVLTPVAPVPVPAAPAVVPVVPAAPAAAPAAAPTAAPPAPAPVAPAVAPPAAPATAPAPAAPATAPAAAPAPAAPATAPAAPATAPAAAPAAAPAPVAPAAAPPATAPAAPAADAPAAPPTRLPIKQTVETTIEYLTNNKGNYDIVTSVNFIGDNQEVIKPMAKDNFIRYNEEVIKQMAEDVRKDIGPKFKAKDKKRVVVAPAIRAYLNKHYGQNIVKEIVNKDIYDIIVDRRTA